MGVEEIYLSFWQEKSTVLTESWITSSLDITPIYHLAQYLLIPQMLKQRFSLQAGAELGQAQVKLEVVDKVVVKVKCWRVEYVVEIVVQLLVWVGGRAGCHIKQK